MLICRSPKHLTAPPQASDEAVIWYDDFNGSERAYTESQGTLDDAQAFGGQGRSITWQELTDPRLFLTQPIRT